MNRRLATLAATAALALALAGCSTSGAVDQEAAPAPTSMPTAVTLPPAPSEEPTEEETFAPLSFGETNAWVDGLAIAVSPPAPFTPTEYAAGGGEGTAIYYTITLTNGTEQPVEPFVLTSMSSGGAEAKAIYDSGNEEIPVTGAPTTAVLPGKSVSWVEAFDVLDPADLVLQVTPGYSYSSAIFTSAP